MCGASPPQSVPTAFKTEAINIPFNLSLLELGPIRQSGPDKEKYPKPNFKTTEKNEENVKSFMAHSMDYVQQLQRPRIIKTHLGLELLPKYLLKTCKVNILSLFLNIFH